MQVSAGKSAAAIGGRLPAAALCNGREDMFNNARAYPVIYKHMARDALFDFFQKFTDRINESGLNRRHGHG